MFPQSRKSAVTWLRLIVILAIIAMGLLAQLRENSPPPADERDIAASPPAPADRVDLPVIRPSDVAVEKNTKEKKAAKEAVGIGEAQAASVVVQNVTLKNESGRVIFRGDVDLAPTLDRIAAGELLDQFRNDGSTFQNRERRLPKRSNGYYREYVVPTEKQSGPGPQRLVVGKEGEVYYTHDHYKSFRKIR